MLIYALVLPTYKKLENSESTLKEFSLSGTL